MNLMVDFKDDLENLACGECESKNISCDTIQEKFDYGVGDEAVELVADVPLCKCEDCGFRFLPSVADDLMHVAVCNHLGVKTPCEVASLRKASFNSRSDASNVTGIGEASFGRWERGALIQTPAFDRYLYLLSFQENVARLRRYIERTRQPRNIIPFPTLSDDKAQARKAASTFRLHPTSTA